MVSYTSMFLEIFVVDRSEYSAWQVAKLVTTILVCIVAGTFHCYVYRKFRQMEVCILCVFGIFLLCLFLGDPILQVEGLVDIIGAASRLVSLLILVIGFVLKHTSWGFVSFEVFVAMLGLLYNALCIIVACDPIVWVLTILCTCFALMYVLLLVCHLKQKGIRLLTMASAIEYAGSRVYIPFSQLYEDIMYDGVPRDPPPLSPRNNQHPIPVPAPIHPNLAANQGEEQAHGDHQQQPVLSAQQQVPIENGAEDEGLEWEEQDQGVHQQQLALPAQQHVPIEIEMEQGQGDHQPQPAIFRIFMFWIEMVPQENGSEVVCIFIFWIEMVPQEWLIGSLYFGLRWYRREMAQ